MVVKVKLKCEKLSSSFAGGSDNNIFPTQTKHFLKVLTYNMLRTTLSHQDIYIYISNISSSSPQLQHLFAVIWLKWFLNSPVMD